MLNFPTTLLRRLLPSSRSGSFSLRMTGAARRLRMESLESRLPLAADLEYLSEAWEETPLFHQSPSHHSAVQFGQGSISPTWRQDDHGGPPRPEPLRQREHSHLEPHRFQAVELTDQLPTRTPLVTQVWIAVRNIPEDRPTEEGLSEKPPVNSTPPNGPLRSQAPPDSANESSRELTQRESAPEGAISVANASRSPGTQLSPPAELLNDLDQNREARTLLPTVLNLPISVESEVNLVAALRSLSATPAMATTPEQDSLTKIVARDEALAELESSNWLFATEEEQAEVARMLHFDRRSATGSTAAAETQQAFRELLPITPAAWLNNLVLLAGANSADDFELIAALSGPPVAMPSAPLANSQPTSTTPVLRSQAWKWCSAVLTPLLLVGAAKQRSRKLEDELVAS